MNVPRTFSLSRCPSKLFPGLFLSSNQLLMTNLFFLLDVDECRTTCMKDTQQCINSQGSYNCKCKAGYEKKNGAADDECTKGKSLSFVGLLITLHPWRSNLYVVLTALKIKSKEAAYFWHISDINRRHRWLFMYGFGTFIDLIKEM